LEKKFHDLRLEKLNDSPVPVKPSPRGNAHMPARIMARPPQKMAIPIMKFGWVTLRVCKLYNDQMSSVDANEIKPLKKLWFKIPQFTLEAA
jgi:hypothetical protein